MAATMLPSVFPLVPGLGDLIAARRARGASLRLCCGLAVYSCDCPAALVATANAAPRG